MTPLFAIDAIQRRIDEVLKNLKLPCESTVTDSGTFSITDGKVNIEQGVLLHTLVVTYASTVCLPGIDYNASIDADGRCIISTITGGMLDNADVCDVSYSKAAERTVKTYQMSLPAPGRVPIKPRDESSLRPGLDSYTPLTDGGYSPAEAAVVFPCIVIKPVTYEAGDIAKHDDDLMRVSIMCGVYQPDDDNAEGARLVVTLLEELRQSFECSPVIEHKYEIVQPMSWELMDSDTRPYWFGELMATVLMFKAERLYDADEDFHGFYSSQDYDEESTDD